MTLHATGIITMAQLKTEFNGPKNLRSYLRGGGTVAADPVNTSIPTSGTISLRQFLGASNNYSRVTITAGVGTQQATGDSIGFCSDYPQIASTSFGSATGNTFPSNHPLTITGAIGYNNLTVSYQNTFALCINVANDLISEESFSFGPVCNSNLIQNILFTDNVGTTWNLTQSTIQIMGESLYESGGSSYYQIGYIVYSTPNRPHGLFTNGSQYVIYVVPTSTPIT